MMDVMQSLEPRKEDKNTIIFNELEDINEIIFFCKGAYDIGYQLNTQHKYVLRYENSNPIGGYGVTFDQKAEFIYKTHTDCYGHFIRRANWK